MVVWVVVVNGCAIVVLLGVSERISDIVRGKVGHMMRVLVDVNRCSSRCVIHVRSVIMVVLIMVNMSLLVHGLMNDSRLMIDFMCYYGLVVNFMCHNWLMVDLVSHDGLVNNFMCYDVCVLW